MRLSARNILKGTVKSVGHGAVNSEVIIELPAEQKSFRLLRKIRLQGWRSHPEKRFMP